MRARLYVQPAGVALTFDDGPDPRFTPAVLDALAEHGAPATFFLVGRHVRQHPALVRRIASAGHTIGSHTFDHIPASQLNHKALSSQVADGKDAVEQVTGESCRYFRPPRGELTVDLVRVVREQQLETWLWSVDTRDYLAETTGEQILEHVNRVSPGGVVLLHDGLADRAVGSDPDRSRTVAAVPGILEILRTRGLAPLAVSTPATAPGHASEGT
jgi:peptidoglycan/xylan/chitin deacetylase (PgdA/CDA1 family)